MGGEAEIVVGAERQHGRAADVGAGPGSCPLPPGRRGAGRSPPGPPARLPAGWRRPAWSGRRSHCGRSRRPPGPQLRCGCTVVFHVEQLHVADDLDERAPAVEVDLALGLLGQGVGGGQHEHPAARTDQLRPQRPATWRAPASPARSRRRTPRGVSLATALAARWRAATTRSPRPSSRIAVRRNAAFLAIGSHSTIVRLRAEQRQRDGRQAAAAADVDHARRLVELAAPARTRRESARRSSTSIDRAAVRLIRAFQRSSDSA